MVSRDSKLQAGALLVGIVLLVVWSLVDGGADSPGTGPALADTLFGFGSAFVLLAGSHLYLASRGEGGMVPVDARWRFVVVVAVSLVLLLVGATLTAAEPVGGVEPALPVFGALLALLGGYVLYEAREGYLERRPN